MKTFLIFLMALSTCQLFSQVSGRAHMARNEIKVNTLYLPGGYPELSYERILGNKSAIGLTFGGFVKSKGSNYVTDILTYDVAILPYYRYYFGKRAAEGLFLEGNGVVFSRESFDEMDKEAGVGLGLALGGKFMVSKSWSIDLLAGGGFNLHQNTNSSGEEGYFPNLPDFYPRLGITVGKRF